VVNTRPVTTVPSQSAYEGAEDAAQLAAQQPQETTPELVSSGARCDLLEARRGSWAERVAGLSWVRERHPMLVHIAATVVLWVLLVGFMVAIGRFLTEVLVPHAGVGIAERSYNSWLEDHRGPLREDVSWVGSTLSGGVVIPLVVAVTCISLAIKRRWRLAAFFLTAILVEVTAYRVIVSLVPRERPDVQRLESLPLLHSFPSGHVAATVAVYGGLALVLASYFRNSRWRFAAYALGIGMPFFVAASRMYRGMHNPSDALAGLLMGCLAVALAVFVARVVGVVAENRNRARETHA
jgi:membrane-associated phospholipid phosphatase